MILEFKPRLQPTSEFGRPDATVEALRNVRPFGPWTLASIDPNHPGAAPIVKTFRGTKDLPVMLDWIANRLGKLNLYFTVNPTRKRLNRKPLEKDIARADFIYVDCDPLVGETASEANKRHRKAIAALDYEPTMTWTTGNGVAAGWKLDPPIILDSQAAIDEAKALGVAMRELLGGKKNGVDAVQNVDRLMRLPYTDNIPDEKKRKKGRTITKAGDFEYFAERTYSKFDLPASTNPNAATSTPDIGDPIYVDDLSELSSTSDRVKAIIEQGRVPGEEKQGDDSRSVWRFEAVCCLIRNGVTLEQILGLLIDDRYLISERALEMSDPEAYARKEILRAKRKVEESIASDFESEVEEPARGSIIPNLYVWRKPSEIPLRRWIYKPNYIRKFIGLTTATGGAGKSSLILVELAAIVTGRPLLGITPQEEDLSGWYWNGEDPAEELERRLAGTLLHYQIKAPDLGSRFYLDSGRNLPIKIAHTIKGETKIAEPVVKDLIEAIRDYKIDCLAIDPFVSSHNVSENDNNAIERVAKQWAQIADVTNCAIQLSHHTRKTGGEAATIEDSRGASSLNYAARTRRAINTMTVKEAERAGVDPNTRRSYFRGDNANSSMTPPADALDWYKFESVNLGNGPDGEGDKVGVVTAWEYPVAGETDLTDVDKAAALTAIGTQAWRYDTRADRWVGKPILEKLGLDSKVKVNRDRVANLVKELLADSTLEKFEAQDGSRRLKPFVRIKSDDFG